MFGFRPIDTTTTSTSNAVTTGLDRGARAGRRVAVDLGVGADVDAAPLEALLDDLGDVLVEAREDLREGLEDGDLGAEVGEQRRELAPDHAATDDGGALRQLADRQELVGRHHDLAVDVEAGQRAGHRARRQHHRVAGELEVARAAARHGDALAGVQPPVAVEHRDLAALQQRRRGRR